LDLREDRKEVVLAAGYVHAKSPAAQELDSDRQIRIWIKLTRVTDNSLCKHTVLANLFSVKVVLSRAACHQTITASTDTRVRCLRQEQGNDLRCQRP
jgi:hypothetical protein